MSAKKRKIWELYELLTEKEIPICQAWISASVGGPSTKLAQLFKAMKKEKADAMIWHRLYPDEAYNDNRLRALFHELGKYLEDYIAFQQFRKTPFLRDLYLIKGLNRRGLAESFRYFYRKVKQRWEKQPIRNSRYYWGLYELEGESLHHASKFTPKENLDFYFEVEKNREKALSFEITQGALFTLGQSKILKQNGSYIQRLAASNTEIRSAEKGELELIYEELFLLIKNEHSNPDRTINQIMSIWEDRKSGDFELNLAGDKSQYLNLAYMVLNTLKGRIQADPSQENRHKQFEFYVWMIENELFQIDGLLPALHYRSVVFQGLKLQRWEEVKDMIERFGRFLPVGSKENNLNFAKARYYFYLKEFHKSLPLLNLKYDNFAEDLLARFYAIKAQYELGEIDTLPYQLDLFKGFVSRNKMLTDPLKSKYCAEAVLLKELCKAKDIEAFNRIKTDIMKGSKKGSKDWFLEKCEEGIHRLKGSIVG